MPSQRLLQPWMKAKDVSAVMGALIKGGAEARFIGGCVRDALLNRPINDIDIATVARPQIVLKLLDKVGIQTIPTGINHGTVTAQVNSQSFEITTLRRDINTDGRHADVIFTDSWPADAERRDFTMNTLSLSPEGQLFDYLDGHDDIMLGKIRFVNDAKTRIKEDILRILRFYRFFAHYGVAEPDEEARTACSELAPLLEKLSNERVRKEIFKLLSSKNPVNSIDIMKADGVLPYCLGRLTNLSRLKRHIAIEELISTNTGPNKPDTLLRLAALVDNNATEINRIIKSLSLSNSSQKRLEAAMGPIPKNKQIKKAIYRLGKRVVQDRLTLAWSMPEKFDPPVEVMSILTDWRPPQFPITGNDMLAAGVQEGPELGRKLGIVENWWIENNFHPDRECCLERLQALISRA